MLSQKQIDVISEPLHDYNILSGVTGSGKSFATNLKWYEIITTAPKNSLFLQTGNNEESVWDNITSKLLEIDKTDHWLQYKAVANKKRIIVRPTGTQVVCTGANTENAKDRIQGKNVAGWYADEIVKQPRSFVEMALSRCRKEENGKMVMTPVIWTCNPDSPSHYIKTDYIDNQQIDIRNWFFGFYDNPLITDEYIEKQKKNFSGVFYDRMILGLWVLAEGVIYNEFARDKHVVDVLPEMYSTFEVGVDWGYSNPMVYLLVGITGDDEYYIIDEYYKTQQLVDDSLRTELTDQFDYQFNTNAFCDRSRPEQMRQLSNIFPELNVRGAENDVTDGIQEVAKRFKMRDNGKYGLYIHSRCINLIRELENYRWKENKSGISKDEPLKEDDHCVDALRYVIYSKRKNFDFSHSPDVQSDFRIVSKNVQNRRR
jgi:PBSX family phage terminase large subunit